MQWKDELFIKGDGHTVKTFLTRSLEAAGIHRPNIDVKAGKESLFVSIATEDDKPFLALDLELQWRVSAHLNAFGVDRGFKGKAWGPLLLKIVLGAVYARGKASLLIRNITDDGPGFWPRIGSLPLVEKSRRNEFSEEMIRVLDQGLADREFEKERTSLRGFKALALNNRERPFWMWRQIARCPLKMADGSRLSHKILDLVDPVFCGDQILIPGEQSTYGILRELAGNIPVFPVYDGCYAHMMKELILSPPVWRGTLFPQFNAG